MAQAVEYAKILSDYLASHHEVGETIPLTGEKITEIISKETGKEVKLYSNAFVEIRRALVFQPLGDKALIPTRQDIDNIKSPVRYKLISKKDFDPCKLDGSMVIGMNTDLVQKIVSRAQEKYKAGAENIEFFMKLLMTADVLYRQGTDKRLEMIPLRPISISIMQDKKEVLEIFVNALWEMGFVELRSTKKPDSKDIMDMDTYRLIETEGWRPILKSTSRSRKSLRLEQILRAKEEPVMAPKEVLTPASEKSQNVIMFSDIAGGDDPQSMEELSNYVMKCFSGFMKKRLEKKDSEIKMLRDELRMKAEDIADLKNEIAKLKESQLSEEAIMNSKPYQDLMAESNRYMRERDEAKEKFNKRYGDEKDLSDSKNAVLEQLDNYLAQLDENVESVIDESPVEEKFKKNIKYKLTKAITGMNKSIENVFLRKN